MTQWVDRILRDFTADLARLWIAADPDDVLLDERMLSGLRERGFDLALYEDSVAFRADYEQRYRTAWDVGQDGPAKALILHLRGTNVSDLPSDYLGQSRLVSLSLANMFPMLSYSVVREIEPEYRELLHAAQIRHASQALGESGTKEFILTHIFRISPHLISHPEDLWRELFRLHSRDLVLPVMLAEHIAQVVSDVPAFKALPVRELFLSRATFVRVIQDAWYRFLSDRGVIGTRTGEPMPDAGAGDVEVPFEHPDVRVIVRSMFLDGLLHPLSIQGATPDLPEWAKIGVVQDPLALRNLVAEGIKVIHDTLPTLDSSYRDWLGTARRFGEVLARFHALDFSRAEGLQGAVADLQTAADEQLQQWVNQHYADLSSLPVAKAPVMVHHIPRFLSMRRASEDKIALVVFDGLAIDQWVQIREALAKSAPELAFDEASCFAWLPTLTSVSRQAIFSGLKPREFSDSIEITASEPTQWARFWQDEGLRANEVLYRKGVKRKEDLSELEEALGSPALRVAGIVVDTIDAVVHGAVLGKRGIAAEIQSWCESGFVERLFLLLIAKGFHVYLTSDHGNVDAVGQGRPRQGVAAETRGERARIYRSETLAAELTTTSAKVVRMDIPGLPSDFLPVFAGGRTAFLPAGDRVVAHGGISTEELIVPFVQVSKQA